MKLRYDVPTATTTVAGLDFMFSEGQLVRTQSDRPDGDSIDVAAICDGDLREPHCARRVLIEAIESEEIDLSRREAEALADWALEAMAVECAEDGEEYAWFFGTLGYRCGDIGESVEADTAALADAAPQLLAALEGLHDAAMVLHRRDAHDLPEALKRADAFQDALAKAREVMAPYTRHTPR